jgi:NAD(P)-dependent dehydrogenase (short-subunit alcohol dehydrogenase family)
MVDVSVVAGAAGGIGQACARRFAANGDTVVLTDLDQSNVDSLADELIDNGAQAVGLSSDITDPAGAASVAEEVQRRGRLRAVAHTAGLSPAMAEWERVLSVNLIGTVLLLDALEPLVVDGTAAVWVASQAGHLMPVEDPNIVAALNDPLSSNFLSRIESAGITDPALAYALSKWRVCQLVIERAPGWGAKRARIVSLSPGIINTPMGRKELEEQPVMALIIEATPLGRVGQADEIASTVEFLCSQGASFITGTDLLVDGGSTAQFQAQLARIMELDDVI